jgi:hypothetical protein
MWQNCKNCDKEILEHISAMFEEEYLSDLCADCVDKLNRELRILTNQFVTLKKEAIDRYTEK